MKSPSDFSSMNFGAAFDAMNPAKFMESMQSLQQSWSGFAGPSALAPTMDLDEIDKRIADLKAVEQWLNLNLTMLQSSVQALQVQRATVATLQNLNETMSSAAQNMDADAIAKAMAQASADSAGTEDSAANPAVWWDLLRQQFDAVTASTLAAASVAADAATHATTSTPPEKAPKGKSKAGKRSAASKPAARTRGTTAKRQGSRKP